MSKPKFDPSKPFKPVEKPAFDPTKGYEALENPAPSILAAGAQGFAQGGTLGYANEIQAGTYPAAEKLMDLFGGGVSRGDEALAAQGISAPQDTYASRLAENKARTKELKKSGAYLPGELTGTVLSAAVPGAVGLKIAPAVSVFGKLAQAAGTGAALGAVQNPEEGQSRLENAAWGAGLGAGAQGTLMGAAKAGGAAKKLLSEATGISTKQIETFLANPKKIEALANKFGNDTQEMADSIRKGFQGKITATKESLGNSIKETLEKKGGEAVDAKSIFDKLSSFETRINPKLASGKEKLAAVNSIREEIASVTDDAGKINLNDLNDLKRSLQDIASGSYQAEGKIFSGGKDAARAAKAAAAESRKLLNSASPEIAKANNLYEALHLVEKKINKNLLTTEKPYASLIQAGTGNNAATAQLKNLEKITGQEFIKPAEEFAAAQAFGAPNILPQGTTGLTLTRAGLGALAGGLGGEATGQGYIPGAIAGTAISSPMALKQLLKLASAAKGPQAQAALTQLINKINPSTTGALAARLKALGD